MSYMTQAQLDAWLSGHKYVQRPAARVSISSIMETASEGDESIEFMGTAKEKKVDKLVFERDDGATITVYGNPKWNGDSDTEPEFISGGQTFPDKKTEEDPSLKREREIKVKDTEQDEAERELNSDPNFGGFTGFRETNQEKQARLEREATRRQSQSSEQRQAQAAADAAYDRRVTVERQAAQDKRQAENDTYQRGRDVKTDAREDTRLELSKNADARAAANADRQAKSQEDANLLANRRLEELDLPKAKREELEAQAKAKRDDLTLQIQLHNTNAQQAAQDYKQWYDQEVDVQLKDLQEQRLAAQATLAREQVREQQKQYQATHGLNTAQFGGLEGERAVQTEISLLPYRVGPTFTTEMAAAIEGVATGDASKVKFSPGSFSFNKPNFEKIRSKASQSAISSVPKYNPADISEPNIPQFQRPDFSVAPKSQPLNLVWPGEPGTEPAWWSQLNKNQPATIVGVQ